MAFSAGIANTRSDLIGAFLTFATANGWTVNVNAGIDTNIGASIQNGTVHAHFRWSSTADDIALYQSLGFTPGSNAWDHPDDSGNGTITTNLLNERSIQDMGNGPFNFFFFAQLSPLALYGVAEIVPGQFRHWGIGQLRKIGDWIGGEFVYGHMLRSPTSVTSNINSLLLDSLAIFGAEAVGTTRRGATVHAEGLPNQSISSKWAAVGQLQTASVLNDRAGNPRVNFNGSSRGAYMFPQHGWFQVSSLGGHIPLLPQLVWYHNTGFAPQRVHLMGEQPHVWAMNMKFFNPNQEFTIGANTYRVYPAWQKVAGSDQSRNLGIAYLV